MTASTAPWTVISGLSDRELLDVWPTCTAPRPAPRRSRRGCVAEVDARQRLRARSGAQSAAPWITHRCRVPGGDARHDVLLARSLRHLPETAARLADGDIGEAQAARIARHHRNPRTTEAAVERDEALLADEATRLTYRQFATVLAYWAQRADPDGTDLDAEARQARRRLHLSRTFDGEWVLDGLLDPVDGTIVDGALRRIEQELFDADRADGPHLDRTPAQRRADALVELARRATATPPGSRRPKPLVTVLVGYETFAGRVCELADGTVLAPSDVAALLDEAVIERAVFDGPDRVIEIGEQRRFTGALRRAIELRDRTCTHPYCDRPAERCDVDHTIPWEHGGPTTDGTAASTAPSTTTSDNAEAHPPGTDSNAVGSRRLRARGTPSRVHQRRGKTRDRGAAAVVRRAPGVRRRPCPLVLGCVGRRCRTSGVGTPSTQTRPDGARPPFGAAGFSA